MEETRMVTDIERRNSEDLIFETLLILEPWEPVHWLGQTSLNGQTFIQDTYAH